MSPIVLVIGGPNGAGKSTAAARLVPPGMPFLNADEIAKGLPGYPSPAVDLWAGRLVLERMDELEQRGWSFAVETTLASRSLAPRVARLRKSGYFFHLAFVWSPSADFSLRRVADRVRMGGHSIPEDVVRRRYSAGLKNLFNLYIPLADRWGVFDNTSSDGHQIVAEGRAGGFEVIHAPDVWALIRRGAGDE